MRPLRAVLLALALATTLVAVSCGRADGGNKAPANGSYRAPAAGRTTDVWAVGDATVSGSAPSRRVAARVRAAHPELFLYLGDVYPSGRAKDFDAYDTFYGSLARRTAPTVGNHESGGRATGFDPYWTRKLGHPLPLYFSFRVAGWTVLDLNSELTGAPAARQARWLRAQVRGGGDCRLAFWHRPRMSAGLHGDSRAVDPLWRALRGRARLVLNGHDHDLQQFKRRHGVTELVAGAGGNGLYRLRRDSRLAWSDDAHYGALHLRLTRGAARYAFVGSSGRVLRRGSERCSGA